MIQFSVWDNRKPNQFPMKAQEFLKHWDYPDRWYHLFEPNLLIRIDTKEDYISLPCPLAYQFGLSCGFGDLADSSPSGDNGMVYNGESAIYGQEIDRLNKEFLFASSALIRQIDKEGKRSFGLIRKHVHLFLNQCGMNYWKEGWFCLRMAINSFRLGMKYGRR